MRIKIVSGTDNENLKSRANHESYAARHGYTYVFDATRYAGLPSPHFRKIHSVLAAMEDTDPADWIWWLDDDAFFTQFDVRLESFLTDVPDDVFFVLCESPVNEAGGWTFISSGQFFIRNTPQARAFLEQVLATPIETARAWWDADRYGLFTNGDQDSMVHVLVTQNLLPQVKILPYEAFNARPYHVKERLDEFFLLHFPGIANKREVIAKFGKRFGTDGTLRPRSYLPVWRRLFG
ncbi:hypothetical protein ACLBXM_05755 [Xanthobacteraceae bacterium A53D]